MHRSVVVALIVSILALASPRPAHACQCVQPSPLPAVSFGWADAVFVGTVTHDGFYSAVDRRLETLSHWLGLPPPPIQFTPFARVNIVRAWKGVLQPEVTLLHADVCTFPFQAGNQYLVYAYAGPDGWVTGFCSGTGETRFRAADLAYLGSLPTIFESQRAVGWLWGAFVAAAGLIPILLGVLIVWRRRRAQLGHPSSEVLR